MYVKLKKDGSIEKYPYSISELRRANPSVSFPSSPSDALLAKFLVKPVKAVERPKYDERTQVVEELQPVVVNKVWTQKWKVKSISAENLAADLESRRASASLTRAQFKLKLLDMGRLDELEAEIAKESTDRATKILYADASVFERMHPAVLEMASKLNFSESELDALFDIE